MNRTQQLCVTVSILLSACAAPHSATRSAVGRAPWDAPPLEHAVSTRDGRTGERLEFDALLDQLAHADVVFLGETHTDETTHRVELATYEGLLARRDGQVVLALEFFERDVQPALDAYLAGEIDEPTFLSRARPWSNYRTAYRPLIELAKARHLPVIASNFPAPLRKRVTSEGVQVLEHLDGDDRRLAPDRLLANTPQYWRRVDNAIRGHLGMMGPRPAADDPRLDSAQSLWDNSMGDSCARALAAHPGHVVLHMNGGFHSQYWDGTVRQLALRRPEAKVRTVAISPSANPAVEEISDTPNADYVVFAEARATDVNEGTYAVYVPRELHYVLHVPARATESARVPLLIWLSDDGATADDGLALWKQRLGDAVAIAVIAAPYREIQEDLVEGGRWFWPDSFDEDVALLREGVERTLGFVLRHQPIDAARVCLAGEGTGATVAAAISLIGIEPGLRAIAIDPRRYEKVKDIPLPISESEDSSRVLDRSLCVVVDASGDGFWQSEAEQYRAIGLDAVVAPTSTDAWRRELDVENRLRAALALTPREVSADTPRSHIVASTPRAERWARLVALDHAQNDGRQVAVVGEDPRRADSAEISIAVSAQEFASGRALPRCPGPFGGSTVVVLPDGLSADETAAWFALEKDDPLAKKSSFHRVRVATRNGERALPVVLGELLEKGRKNVLILPAQFCASGDDMRALAQGARAFEDRMTLYWRPGLGGRSDP